MRFTHYQSLYISNTFFQLKLNIILVLFPPSQNLKHSSIIIITLNCLSYLYICFSKTPCVKPVSPYFVFDFFSQVVLKEKYCMIRQRRATIILDRSIFMVFLSESEHDFFQWSITRKSIRIKTVQNLRLNWFEWIISCR